MGSRLVSQAQDLEPSLSGSLLGPYRLEERLGLGSFGSVYRAQDTRLNRPVAVKVLARTDARNVERFRREARALSALRHPNLVLLHDAGESEGRPYLVMELIEGQPLSAVCDPARLLPVARVVEVIRQAAEAIEFAHRHGVLHRDLKPANLLLDADSVRVVDFGLAFLLEPEVSRLSQTGAWVGSPAYMAPEQTESKPPDARTDVYGLGATLYHALCGRTPLEDAPGENPVLAIHRHVPANPSRWRAEIPPALDAICARCLAKDPALRYPTAAALAEALETCLDRPQRRLRWRGLALLALCFGIGLGWAQLSRGTPPPSQPPPSQPPPSQVLLLLTQARAQPFGRAGDTAAMRLLNAALEAAAGGPREPEVLLALAKQHFYRCRFRDSLAVADRVLELDPENLQARSRRGTCLNNLRQPEDAVLAWEAVRDADPNGKWGLLAEIELLMNDDPPASARAARLALEQDPQCHEAWLTLGYVYLGDDRYEQSQEAFQRCADLEPRDPRPEIGLISLASLRREDAEALSRIQALLDDLGSDAPSPFLAMRGKIHYGIGRQDLAEADLTRALEADPDDADFLVWRGIIRMRRALRDEARQDFRQARTADPDGFERVLNRSCDHDPELAAAIRRMAED